MNKRMPASVRAQFIVKLLASVAIVSYCLSNERGQFSHYWFIPLVVTVLEAAAVAMPFSISHSGSRAVFTADQMVVVAAAILLPTNIAVLVIPLGYGVGCVAVRELYLSRLDDTTGYLLGAFLAFNVAHLIGPVGLGWNSIAGALVAGAIHDPFTLLLLTLSLAAVKQVKIVAFFRTSLASTLVTWPWLFSLGVLIGVIGSDAPWALPLMGAPLALVFM